MAVLAPQLDQVDPAEAWQPWRPSADEPWGPKWAAHLYRRAGFGPSRADLAEAARLGCHGTLELLLRGRPEARQIGATLDDIGRVAAEADDGGDQLRGWWLYVMLRGGHPLREKMTLFWHNHFATSLVKVRDPVLMFRQNELLRAQALGKFGPLLRAISRDGAMLLWLDSSSNVRGKPNENYARELLELFSLGVGNYTELDVREAARAFTGWRTDGTNFAFDARLHDGGAKTVLGQTGPWDGDDVARIVLEQPSAARFLVRKLYGYLVSETAPPPDALLEPLCESFRRSDYASADLVRTILASRLFFSPHAFRQRIKGPLEYVLGAVRAVHQPESPDEALPQQVLVPRLAAMGQPLFTPPNVKGWPGGLAWLNTSTVLTRDNFAEALAMGTLWPGATPEPTPAPPGLGPLLTILKRRPVPTDLPEEPAPPRSLDPARIVDDEGLTRPEEIASALLDAYLPGGVRPEAQPTLVAFLADGKPTGPALARRVREAVHAIMSLSEYQLA